MILHRLCEINFSDQASLFNGAGAGKFGGRWNSIDIRALYCAENREVCAAELGFHKIITNIDLYNSSITKKEKKIIGKDYLLNRQLALAKFELNENDLKIEDLTSDLKIAESFKKEKLDINTKITNLRKSSYTSLPTRIIGDHFYNNGFAGIKVPSARCEDNIVVLYPQNIPRDLLNLHSVSKVKLHAVGLDKKKLKNGMSVQTNYILFEVNKNNSLIEICQF